MNKNKVIGVVSSEAEVSFKTVYELNMISVVSDKYLINALKIFVF